MSHPRTSFWIRFIGTVMLAGGAALCAAQVFALMHTTPDHMIDYAMRAAAYLLVGLGLGSGLIGLASLLGNQTDPAETLLPALQHLQSQMDQTHLRLGTLAANFEKAQRDAVPSISPIDPESVERIEQLLHEIRELSLLGDTDRRMRLLHHLEQRKRHMSRQIMDFVNNTEFARAEKILIDLESQFPGDAHAVGCRRDLDDARRARETQEVRQQAQKIEHLMRLASWDQALIAVNDLVENFPRSDAASELLERVARERDAFIDINAQAQFDEVRRHVENRTWRLAVTGAQKLLAKYPTHQRAQQLRQQLRTIQENADIEERQEAEVRIQEMIRAGQFRDAIDLAEDVIRRFPGSPQAEAIEAMLPRLQDLAGEPQSPVAFDA